MHHLHFSYAYFYQNYVSLTNSISKLCSNTLPGFFFNSAIDLKGHFAVESRTAETTSFSIYHLQSGQLLSEIQSYNLTPWYSLAAIDATSLILRYFKNKKNPSQVSFIRYDATTDQLLDLVNISQIEQPESGIPTLYLPDTEGFQMIAQFLNQSIVLGCEYLEQDGWIIIGYYSAFDKNFERKLLILENGKEVLHEVQDTEMSGFAAGSFFTFQNRLIFIKKKTEINIYEI